MKKIIKVGNKYLASTDNLKLTTARKNAFIFISTREVNKYISLCKETFKNEKLSVITLNEFKNND